MEQIEVKFDCDPNCVCLTCATNRHECQYSDCPWCSGKGIRYPGSPHLLVSYICKHFRDVTEKTEVG